MLLLKLAIELICLCITREHHWVIIYRPSTVLISVIILEVYLTTSCNFNYFSVVNIHFEHFSTVSSFVFRVPS